MRKDGAFESLKSDFTRGLINSIIIISDYR